MSSAPSTDEPVSADGTTTDAADDPPPDDAAAGRVTDDLESPPGDVLDAAGAGTTSTTAAEPEAAPGGQPLHPRNPTTVVAITVVALLVLAMLALYLDRRNAPSAAPVASRPNPVSAPAAGAPAAGGPVSSAGSGSFADPALDGRGMVHDDFERKADGLGTIPFGPTWAVARGTWSVDGKQAAVRTQSPNELALATINAIGQNVIMEVTLPNAEAGAALAFRGVNAQTYWLASIDATGVVAYHVEDGKPTVVGGPTPAAITSGMKLGVDADKEKVRILVNGKVVLEIADPQAGGRAIGLGTAPNAASTVTFDDLRYRAR